MDKVTAENKLSDIVVLNELDGNWEFAEVLAKALMALRKDIKNERDYCKVRLVRADGEERVMLMDTRRHLLYPVESPLESYQEIGFVVVGVEDD